jgi:hypothetical protein
MRHKLARSIALGAALMLGAAVVHGSAWASASGGSLTSATPRQNPQAQPFAGGLAVPLPTGGPSWYDLAYHRQVMAAGALGAPLPAAAAADPGPLAAPAAIGLASSGIRPGTWLVTVTTNPVGFAWCSANFVFQNGGTYGLGTAGHCAAADALGAYPDVTAYVLPPVGSGSLPGFYHIGKFVLSHNNGIGDDFAMIQIYPEFNAWMNPTMPVWGGPIGTYTGSGPTVVQHFGHGAVVGTGGTPRAGVAPVWTATAFAWYGVGAPGDSGSGVRVVTGEAAGDFTHIVIFDPTLTYLPGMLAGTRSTAIQSIAAGWTMLNGSLIPVP